MKVYGLSTCVVCQRACKTLEAEGIEIEFRDVRSDPLSESELNELLNEFGDRLVDRTTNDYRSLNDWLKNSESEAQISARPKLMARPVIQDQGKWFLGWDSTVEKAVLGR